MKEKWRIVDGFPDYEISNKGRIRSYKNNKWGRRDRPVILSLRGASQKYLRVVLHNKGKNRRVFVHTLVLEAFVGTCPKGKEARHWDGNFRNNDVRNLSWSTHLENMGDRIRHGTAGVRPSGKVVIEIQKRYVGGESLHSIARDFSMWSHPVVESIAKGTHWSLRGD